jgi:hypothetical protein
MTVAGGGWSGSPVGAGAGSGPVALDSPVIVARRHHLPG